MQILTLPLNVLKDVMLRKVGCCWRLILCKCGVLPQSVRAGGGAHLLPSAVTVEDYQDDTEEENIVEIGDNEED